MSSHLTSCDGMTRQRNSVSLTSASPSRCTLFSFVLTSFYIAHIPIHLQLQFKIHGLLKPEREHADFRGTTIYASPFTHTGRDQCPRDDLCSILHVFLDMICGKLPWGDAARSKDKSTAIVIKGQMYSDPDNFITWTRNEAATAQDRKVCVSDLLLIGDVLIMMYLWPQGWTGDSNFPEVAQQKLRQLILYLKVRRQNASYLICFCVVFILNVYRIWSIIQSRIML